MDRKENDRGQSLIEIAIILPILLLLLLGVAEMGMGLRNYLILVNANREAARFAARGRFTDMDTAKLVVSSGGTTREVGYLVPFLRIQHPQMEDPPGSGSFVELTDVRPNAGVIITHIEFAKDFTFTDTITPTHYVTGVINVRGGEVVPPQLNFVGRDDIRWLSENDSRLDLVDIRNRHGKDTYDINQLRNAEGLDMMSNHVVVVETFYLHRPITEGLVPSPWVMYSLMEIRIVSDRAQP
jgi:hypothetical protein